MKRSYYKLLAACLICFAGWACSKDNAADVSASSTGMAGSLSKFTIVDNFLYAVDSRYLYAYDISNPVNPVIKSTIPINFNVETIYPFKNRLFIGTTNGMFIYSIDVQAAPVKIGEALHVRSCDPVVANDTIAFVTLKGNTWCGPAVSGLYVHDIKNVMQPVLIKTLPIPSPEGLGLQGSILYICCNSDGLKVFNVANPANPIEIKTIGGGYFKDVIPYGNLLICYVSTGISLYDITIPGNPVFIKEIAN